MSAQVALELDLAPRRKASLWRDAWRRLLRNRLACAGGIVILFYGAVALLAGVVAPYAYDVPHFDHALEFPSGLFYMGTDQLGRDVLSRMIYGARVSMTVGFLTQFLVLLIGVPVGSISGFYGGKVDVFLMRVVDVMYAFPQLLFVLLIMSMLGSGLYNVFLAIGLTGWVGLARLTRGQILTLREREYVKAARVSGSGGARIIFRHLIPNSLTPIIVSLTFGIPAAIFTEASLSFIGVGITPPTPSWGQMVGENQGFIRSFWHLAIFPSAAIGSLMLSFTFLGDGLRDALDPKMND